MVIGSGQGLTAPQIWTNPTRTLTADPSTDAVTGSIVWNHVSRLLTIGGAAIPSGSTQLTLTSANVPLNATGTTNFINTSGTPGVLLAAGIHVTTTIPGGTLTAQLEYVIDGVLGIILPLYTGANVWDLSILTVAQFVSGTGLNATNYFSYILPVQFGSSLIVRINVISSSATGGALNMSSMCFTHP